MTAWTLAGSTAPAEELVPALQLDFDASDESVARAVGHVVEGVPGPAPPEFPDFPPDNQARRFEGDGGRLVIDDPGDNSDLDFAKGDAITLSSWLQLDTIGSGANVYLVGKGRTHRAGFPANNQNWALRLTERDGLAHASFLFADATGTKWHRWTGNLGFVPSEFWHHIAITYRFGEPESLRCWVNGVASPGTWDMSGSTAEGPFVDNDQIWVASSMGGNRGNSFAGAMDRTIVFRGLADDDQIASLYRRVGPPREQLVGGERVPSVDFVDGAVFYELFELGGSHSTWYPAHRAPDRAITSWAADHFYLHRLPFRYDSHGIRESWKAPVLLRASARVDLVAGNCRVLVRARGLSRLWMDGVVVARIAPHQGSTDGHNPVDPLPAPPLPGMRIVGHGDQETVAEFVVTSPGPHEVIFESLVGGDKFRAEPGETFVALETSNGQTFALLGPHLADNPSLAVTDEVIANYRQATELRLVEIDDHNRNAAAQSQNAFWQHRHEVARQVVGAEQATPDSTLHPIDAFIVAKIEAARARINPDDAAGAQFFHNQVLPILRSRCQRCHGDKETAGLSLDNLESALQGGDSGDPAVFPGDSESSPLIMRLTASGDEQMPPGERLPEHEIALLQQWVDAGATWPDAPVDSSMLEQPPLIDDAAFIRRAYLDTVGVIPDAQAVREFIADQDLQKRERLIDHLLNDSRFADHWVAYWQDVLAENPNPLKPSLNNTGPFRWFLYEQLRDHVPWDRMVTELIMLRGSEREGGSAGFGFAADNDAPLAARAHVIGTAFLGIDMQCARCHDSPYSSPTQSNLFALAAMMARKPLTVPATSTVAPGFFASDKGRESLIRVTLNPGESVEPQWPFAEVGGQTDDETLQSLMQQPEDIRERLAARVTSPHNRRFAQVVVNRVWKRLIGAGFVEPVQDWEGAHASHPELLDWLADDFVRNGYDARQLVRRIMTSALYQRQATGHNLTAEANIRFFAAPDRRRMTAEQIVDSLFTASGTPLEVEQITFDPEARRPANTMISLGAPQRAWQFATLANERDRPSLSLPRAQAVVDVLSAFGWDGSRQNPVHQREQESSPLQPGVLANGTVSTWVTRVSVDNALADWALHATSADDLVETVYLSFLGRLPSEAERAPIVGLLDENFENRRVATADVSWPTNLTPLPRVSWSNHLHAEANRIQIIRGERAVQGPAYDPRLETAWREAYEDVIWAVVNSPEFVWIP